MPHLISCGEDTYSAGDSHCSRRGIGVYDMLVVTRGMLPMGEDDAHWELGSGQALILRPHSAHYQFKPCAEETHFYWLHFHIVTTASERLDWNALITEMNSTGYTKIMPFEAGLPQHKRLAAPDRTYDKLKELVALEYSNHYLIKSQQQILFQQLLLDLLEADRGYSDKSFAVASKAADYLRRHYRERITLNGLAEHLHFHPVYITRCMKQVYGLTPVDYLNRYRVERSKLLLIGTPYTMPRIAEEVGFLSASYFSRCFSNWENMSPIKFRQRYSQPMQSL
jgi:AraC-like DNA-binding protein